MKLKMHRSRLSMHKPARKLNTERPYNSVRGKSARRWARIRDYVMRKKPECVTCLAEGIHTSARELDHIIPLKHRGTDDLWNLQPLCWTHHQAKTAKEAAPDYIPPAEPSEEEKQRIIESLEPAFNMA